MPTAPGVSGDTLQALQDFIDARILLVGGSIPSGSAGGDLSGTYPNPGVADGLFRAEAPAFITPPFFNPSQISTATNPGSLTPFGCRVFAPRAGFLRDLSFYLHTTAGGNGSVAVYDTGQAAGSSVRTLLWSSASTSLASTSLWQPFDPGASALPIVRGRQYDVFGVVDSTTQLVGRLASTVGGGAATLPSGFLSAGAGAVTAKLFFTLAALSSVTAWPTTLTEANVSVSGTGRPLIARVG